MTQALATPAPVLDPRVLQMLRTPCGTKPSAISESERKADTAARLTELLKPPVIPQQILLMAQAEPTATPAAPPESSTPDAAPSPSPTPSQAALPPAPPGPGVFVPPTPRPQGSSLPTAPPLPTPSPPAANATGPVLLVNPTGTPPAIPAAGSSASPIPRATSAGATPAPTLAPFQIAVLADRFTGTNRSDGKWDAIGNVHLYYSEGQIVGDRGHYDGDHTAVISGHTYLINKNQDAILYADEIRFDKNTNKATLTNGRGETTEGVQKGKIYYTSQTLTTSSSGTTHGEHASFTTCVNPHGGYHVEARQLDVLPGDKLIARKATIWLGPLAIFYLPLLVIPLRDVKDPRRQASFLPVVGYSEVEGFYVKARIGFNPSNTYYGYYRIEYFSKRGLGLGYTAYIGTKTNRRSLSIDSYTISDHLANARLTNVSLLETENISNRLRSQIGVNYTGDFGPNVNLPARLDINATLAHTGTAMNETLTYQRTTQGSSQTSSNLAFSDLIQVTKDVNEQLQVSYGQFDSPFGSTSTLHLQSQTHYFSKIADFNLQYDKSDLSAPTSGYDRVPELTVMPHINFHGYRFPFTTELTIGEYTEPQNHFSTQRAQIDFNQPLFFKVGASDFTATEHFIQDFYGTGDAKGFETQSASFTTPINSHIVNSITYNEQHPIGPANVPFQLIDRLDGGSHQASDVLRFYNADYYTFSLSSGTAFNRQAQSIAYQLNARPSPRSMLIIGGSWQPGPGQGFFLTNVQAITPFGRDTTLELSSNVDWKNRGRLLNKNVYLSKIIGDCYRVDLSYNQDLKQFNFSVVILAFPNQSVGLGLGGQPTSILPQNFAGF
jgi:lipopolysaccharide assembly outer membrane protein LptD (OstA)